MTWLQRFLAILYPAALVCLVEAGAVVAWAGVERPYLPRLAGLALLAVLAAAATCAFLLARFTLESPRGWLALSWGVIAALSTALVLANGAPPRYAPGSVSPGWAAVLAGGAALLAALVRLILPRPLDRGRALLLEPLLLGAATAGTYVLAGRLGLETGTLHAVLPGAGLLLVAIAACVLLAGRGRPDAAAAVDPAGPWRDRLAHADGSTRAALSAVLWIAAVAAAAAALGRAPFEPMRPARPGAPPDVLLVVLDGLRADALAEKYSAAFVLPPSGERGEEGERRLASEIAESASFGAPNLARMAGGGIHFDNAHSTSCWTVPAHASLFTGMQAAVHGVGWARPRLPAPLPSLPTRLQQAGRLTVGLSASPWISPVLGFDRGFHEFVTTDPAAKPWIPWAFALVPPLARAVDGTLLWEDEGGFVLASEALRALSGADRPAFVYVNLVEAQLPYRPPARVLERGFRDSEVDPQRLRVLPQDPLMDLRPGFRWRASHLAGLRALYAAEVSYLDDLMGRMLGRLRRSGRLGRTLVVVTAGHGSNLGEHPPLDPQLGLWDTLVRIPLIVYPPAPHPGRGRDARLVSLADLGDAVEAWAAEAARAPDGLPAREAVYFDYDLPSPLLATIEARLGLDPAPWAHALTGVRSASGKWVLGDGGLREGAEEPESGVLGKRLQMLAAGR